MVTDRLATLERLGLITEGDLGPAIGGRAPRHVRLQRRVSARCSSRTSIGRRSPSGSPTCRGNLIVEHHEAVDLALGPDALLDRLTTLFVWLLDERGGKERAWAIAIALPEVALVDTNDSDVFSIAALDTLQAWRSFDFATELSLRFGAPCWVRANTQMMTLGEMKDGAGQGERDVLCVRIDRSVSAGVVSDGQLHPRRAWVFRAHRSCADRGAERRHLQLRRERLPRRRGRAAKPSRERRNLRRRTDAADTSQK